MITKGNKQERQSQMTLPLVLTQDVSLQGKHVRNTRPFICVSVRDCTVSVPVTPKIVPSLTLKAVAKT
jgi:hypothetical protein